LHLDSPESISLDHLTLTGRDSSTTTTVALATTDMTGAGRGWNIVTSSTPFTDPRGHRLRGPTFITAASASSATGSCSVPHNSVTYPLRVSLGSAPVKVFSADPDTGSGPAIILLTLEQSIPASTYRGNYSSTWTFTISSGP
jgi:hypothetical protein